MKVEIYSDIICPWCYIGKRRFDAAVAEFAGAAELEVVFRPFQLDPDAVRPALPVHEYLSRRYGDMAAGMMARAVDAGRADGLEFDFDAALAANTFDAHRLQRFALEEYGGATQRQLAEVLFEGHFTRGLDLSDPDVLARLGAEVGLEAAEVRRYLASSEGVAEVEVEIAKARALGIQAVPTFVVAGRYAVQGAQPASVLVRALESVAREAAAVSVSTGDRCEDDSCAPGDSR